MTMPYQEVNALKRTREFLRSILSEPRRPQFALKAEASSVLRHYPSDCFLDKLWSEHVCEHGQDREFCRECEPIENEYVKLLKEVRDDEHTTKYMRMKIEKALNKGG